MSNRKTALFYAVLIAVASLSVGMVIASRLGLSPESSAQTVAAPAMNSAPLNGAVDAGTFRSIAKTVSPAVVNIRTESKQRAQDLNDFFGGGGDDLFDRFFGVDREARVARAARAARPPARSESRRSRPQAPASSSTRPDSSSPTTMSSKARTRSKCRSTAKATIRNTRRRSS